MREIVGLKKFGIELHELPDRAEGEKFNSFDLNQHAFEPKQP